MRFVFDWSIVSDPVPSSVLSYFFGGGVLEYEKVLTILLFLTYYIRKFQNAEFKLEKNESLDNGGGTGGGLLQMATPVNENQKRKTLSKQSSLPPDFKLTINVRPPSPDPNRKDVDSGIYYQSKT